MEAKTKARSFLDLEVYQLAEVGYLSENELKSYESRIDQLGVKLNNFIKSISRLVKNNQFQ